MSKTIDDVSDIEMADTKSGNTGGNPSGRRMTRSFRYQTAALLKKSAINQWRQYRTNACQIFFPLLLIILLRLLQLLVTSFVQDQEGSFIPAVLHPPVEPFYLVKTDEDIINRCPNNEQPPVFEAHDLYYLDYTGIGANITSYITYPEPVKLLKGIIYPERGNLQQFCEERPFYLTNVTYIGYDDKAVFDESFYTSYKFDERLGGYMFHSWSNNLLDVSLFFNETLTRAIDVPVYLDLIGRGFLTYLTGGNIGGNLTTSILLGARDFPTKDEEPDFDLISLIGPYLYVFVFQLTFPVILGSLVYEKENKLREIMKMMGLHMTTYWVVTYLFSFLIYFVAFLIMWAAAGLLGFRYFTINDGAIIFLFFFFWGHLLVAFSLFFSVFFNKSRTATVVGYIWVFATGILAGQVIDEYFANPETPYAAVFFLTCIPQFALYRGLRVLSNGVVFNGRGIKWEGLVRRDMLEVWIFLIVEWIIVFTLALYLEATLKTGYGVKKHPLFFLQKSYWRPDQKAVVKSQLKEKVEGEPEDVAEVRKKLISGNYFMRVEDLHKVYPGVNGLPEKVAVKSLALGVNYGECFGFLGPNGAGKSTTINVLCGLYRPTSGTAIVDGFDIQDDIDQVHMMMGVCPQDNVLWDDLTGPEHLEFYGRIKNMRGKALKEEIEELLKAVNLHEDKKKKSKEYSGGMKRRLSVACSLMGSPKVVLLDEPSTGLDPASRRQLWTLINNRKKKCAMLLTTHAMEEADALCDRLGIFVSGELKCVGTSSELKLRYGKGYKLSLTCDPKFEKNAHEFIKSIAPEATLLNSIAGTSNFEIPKSSIRLSEVFTAMEGKKNELKITDWGISNTTLEEVFLKITDAEEEKLKKEEMDLKTSVNEVELVEKNQVLTSDEEASSKPSSKVSSKRNSLKGETSKSSEDESAEDSKSQEQ